MEGVFNNREVSLGVWVSVLLIWALTKRDFRRTLSRVVAAAFNWRIFFPVVVFAAYIFLVIFLLEAFGYWKFQMLKATTYWFALSGLMLFGKAVTESKPLGDWKQALRAQVSIIVILAFIVNSYTFSIYIEMALVPIVAFISLLAAYAEYHHKDEPVENLLKGAQAFIGLVILFFAGMNAYSDYIELASLATAQELLLPAVLTTMAIPYMYFIALYSAYDRILRMATFKQPPKMASCIRNRILWSGGLSLRRARVIAAIKPYEFMRTNHKEDVDTVIQKYLSGEADP